MIFVCECEVVSFMNFLATLNAFYFPGHLIFASSKLQRNGMNVPSHQVSASNPISFLKVQKWVDPLGFGNIDVDWIKTILGSRYLLLKRMIESSKDRGPVLFAILKDLAVSKTQVPESRRGGFLQEPPTLCKLHPLTVAGTWQGLLRSP